MFPLATNPVALGRQLLKTVWLLAQEAKFIQRLATETSALATQRSVPQQLLTTTP
jgi:hypothetical protein